MSHPQSSNDTKTVSKVAGKEASSDARVTLRVPNGIHEKAKALADAEHISLNSLIVRVLERAVARKGKQ